MRTFFEPKFLAAIMMAVASLALTSCTKHAESAAPAPSAASEAREASAGEDVPAPEDLKRAQFNVLVLQFKMSAEALASMMPTNGMADSRLELCNSFVEGGMMDWKADQSMHRLRVAVRDCHNIVLGLCREGNAEDALQCSAYKSQTAGYEYH